MSGIDDTQSICHVSMMYVRDEQYIYACVLGYTVSKSRIYDKKYLCLVLVIHNINFISGIHNNNMLWPSPSMGQSYQIRLRTHIHPTFAP